MNARKESESYRLDTLQRFKEKYDHAKPSEVLEAELVIAKFREQEARDREAIARLSTPLPKSDSCPQCYYLHGKNSELNPTGSDTAVDLFRCGTCGFEQERHPNR